MLIRFYWPKSAAALDPAQTLLEDEKKNSPKSKKKRGRKLGNGNSKRDPLSSDSWACYRIWCVCGVISSHTCFHG